MRMWHNFFTETEKNGTLKLRPHRTLEQEPKTIKNIKLCPWNVSSDVKYIVLTVESTMTVYELLDMIGKHFNETPVEMVLECSRINGGHAIGAAAFCTTLGDLNIADGEEISVRSIYKSYKSPPLIKESTKKLTRRAENVFKKIFH